MLLLEDVAAAPGGARVGDNVAGCSRPEAEAAVRRLAGYQAAWWARPELEALGWLASYGEGAGRRQELYQQLWPAYCAKFGDRIPAPVREVGSRFGAHVARLWRRLRAPPQTIVHGDFRLDNLLFGPPPVDGTLPVTAIDWQATARGRGAADVAYFAGVCLPPDDRRAWERGLVRAYRAALLAGGGGSLAPDRLPRLWRERPQRSGAEAAPSLVGRSLRAGGGGRNRYGLAGGGPGRAAARAGASTGGPNRRRPGALTT